MSESAPQWKAHICVFMALMLTAFFSINVNAQQSGFVSGSVVDGNGRGLTGVNVSVLGSPGGTATGDDGAFLYEVPAGEEIEIAFSFIGYQLKRIPLVVSAGDTVKMNVTLEKSSTSLPAVEVRDRQREVANFIKLDPRSVEQIPNVSGNFEAVLKTFPGVVSNNELSSQYSVRGGNYDENLVYVNDIEIYRPYLIRSGQQEGLSFINPDMVEEVNFSAGGFAAEYGDKMSSVLDIQYRKPKEFGGSAELGLQGAGLHLEGLTKDQRLTYLFGFRYRTNQYILNSLETKGEYKPSFGDVQTLLTYEASDRTEISLLGNYNFNKYRVVPENRETEFGTVNEALRLTIYFEGQEVDVFNTLTGAFTVSHDVSDSLNLKFIASAYRSDENESFDILGQYFIDELERDLSSDDFGDVRSNLGIGSFLDHARNELDVNVYNVEHKGKYFGNNITWKWGVKYQHENIDDKISEWAYIDSAEYSLPHPPDNVGGPGDPNQLIELNEVIKTRSSLSSNRFSGYFQGSLKFGSQDNFSLTGGARASYWDLNEELVVSPRASIAYYPDWEKNWTFRFATGIYYQPPFYRELRDLEGNVNTEVKAQRSIHFILGSDYTFLAWGREFKLVSEAYYKKLDNLVPYKIENLRIRYLGDNKAEGYAAGMDFRINGDFVPGIQSWASLSFLKTEEDLKDDFYYEYYNSEGELIIPGFTFNDVPVDSTKITPGNIPRPTDQRVTFSLFFQDYLPKFPTFRMNMTLVFGTGLPFGPPGDDRYKDVLRFPSYRRVDIGFQKIIIDEDSNKQHRLKFANNLRSLWIGLDIFNLLQVNNTISYLWVTDVSNRTYAVPNYLSARTINLRVKAKF